MGAVGHKKNAAKRKKLIILIILLGISLIICILICSCAVWAKFRKKRVFNENIEGEVVD